MAKQRIEWLDSLRGVAMIFVIMGHACALPAFGKMLIYSFHMPLFFAISGCVFRVSKYDRLRDCVADKARSLLLPYLLLYLINIPLHYVAWGFTLGKFTKPYDLFLSFISDGVWGTSSCAPLWFLPVLFMASVLFWCLARLESKHRIPLWASMIILLILAIIWNQNSRGQGFFQIHTVPWATIFYYLGYLFWQNKERIFKVIGYEPGTPRPKLNWRFYPIMIGLIALGMYLAIQNGKISMMSNIYRNYAITFASACSTSIGLAMVMMRLPKMKMFDYTGKNSLAFFGFHRNLVHFFEKWAVTNPLFGHHCVAVTLLVWLLLFPIAWLADRYIPEAVGKRRVKKPKASAISDTSSSNA